MIKILIVRIGRLGDMVMILPAIHAIIRNNPSAQLFALSSPDGKRILPQVGIKPENIFIFRNAPLRRLQDRQQVKDFVNGDFDLIYCFETKARTQELLPAKTKRLQASLVLEHYALRCLNLVDKTQSPFSMAPYLSIPIEKDIHLRSLLSQYDIDDNTLLIGLHPSYSGYGKWGHSKERKHRLWPWRNFALLAQMLLEYAGKLKLDLKIVMNLLPTERTLGEKIRQACSHSILLLDWPPDFQRYLSLIKRLNILITPNTGVMHLAASLDTPVVALFSKHHPIDCGPFMAKHRFRVLRSEDMAKPKMGLAAISVEDAFEEVKALLDAIYLTSVLTY